MTSMSGLAQFFHIRRSFYPPPLGQLPLLERVAMHVVHRAPWNTFRHGHFFQLPKHRASVLRSPTVACAAALFRTATRTITHWPRWIEQMKVVAADNLSFSRVHGEKIFYPECWDSPPPLRRTSSGPMRDLLGLEDLKPPASF